MTVLRLGGERGMTRQEKLFLTKNTLPVFGRLLDLLDALPGELRNRSVSPFFYAGLATRYEDKRLTEQDRDNSARADQCTSVRKVRHVALGAGMDSGHAGNRDAAAPPRA